MIAVVTGASRGVGRGIALSLGDLGATVFVTGRTVDGETSIGETARLVTARGGQGIAVRCDHSDDEQVSDVFRQVRQTAGSISVLVNNVWGGNDLEHSPARFWEQPMDGWHRMFNLGVRAHYVATSNAIPLMDNGGLIVTTSFNDEGRYAHGLLYDLALNAMNRFAFGLSHELRDRAICSVAISPGFVRTERVLAAYEENPALAEQFGGVETTESPEYIGRAVAALAQDSQVMSKTGQTLTVADLAVEYGFTDLDGTRPGPFRLPAFGAEND